MISRALVVEDDQDLGNLTRSVLASNGFDVQVACNGAEGLAIAREFRPDLITLDLNLPDTDGLILCRGLRSVTDAYIIMLTARNETQQVLLGLESGADDYMTKPFSLLELSARVNAVMRRPRDMVVAGSAPAHPELAHGGLTMRPSERTIEIDGAALNLTRTEFDLLEVLARRPEQLVTRQDLLTSVWGTSWSDRHLVDVHVANLRRKLREVESAVVILTVRGLGYRLHSRDQRV